MSTINNKEVILTQYKDDNNLNSRMALHSFNENKVDWHQWSFDKMDFKEGDNILELGCGNGMLWKKNSEKINNNCTITLTDISEGMLKSAKDMLKDVNHNFKFKVMDIQNIPYPDNSFDVIIARHMLYHVPDLDKAFSEIKRVLKPKGTFYATTSGSDAMKQLGELVRNFDENIAYSPSKHILKFGLESGKILLEKYFDFVVMEELRGNISVSNIEPIVSYVLSTNAKEVLVRDKLYEFRTYLEKELNKKGKIDITTSAGILSVRK